MSASKPLGPIEHVVVLMFENRSFDNMLGDLHPYGPDFDGVPPGYSNPVNPDRSNSPTVAAFHAAASQAARIMPFPDPNEHFSDMAEQIRGGTMTGFVHNYAKVIKAHGLPPETADNIMQYYKAGPGGNIPITSWLAGNYAVSDRYFGSGPVQTWPNRLFAHCGTPGSHKEGGKHYAYLNNVDYPNYCDWDPLRGQLDYKTVFELLDGKHTDGSRKAWKVYYDGEVPVSAFLKYVYDHWYWDRVEGGNVYAYKHSFPDLPDYADFAYDVRHNTLPTYSFIEPRYQKYSAFGTVPPNSNHPGGSTVNEGGPPIDVSHGEILLRDVYKTLSSNPALFDKTLLIVTYDEHGGLFDHVDPPLATSPFKTPQKDFANFAYTQYGPRVPAIFINPHVRKPVYRPPHGKAFDHASIISTLCAQFGLAGPLTPRDADAPPFANLLDPAAERIEPGEPPEVVVDTAETGDEGRPVSYPLPQQDGTLIDAVYRSFLMRNKIST